MTRSATAPQYIAVVANSIFYVYKNYNLTSSVAHRVNYTAKAASGVDFTIEVVESGFVIASKTIPGTYATFTSDYLDFTPSGASIEIRIRRAGSSTTNSTVQFDEIGIAEWQSTSVTNCYYAWGSEDGYRYGFNGMEKDDEVKGSGNSLDFGARIYDSRLGRWMSLDPLFKKYPDVSAYCFALNNPFYFIDFDGRQILPTDKFKESHYYTTILKVVAQRETNSFSKKWLTQYMGAEKDLELKYHNMTFYYDGTDYSDIKATGNKMTTCQSIIAFNSGSAFTPGPGMGDNTQLVSSLTEIGTVALFFHELIHASTGLNTGKSDHESMATTYHAEMVAGLKEYAEKNGLKYESDVYEMLSWIGLDETAAFAAKFGGGETQTAAQKKLAERYIYVKNNYYFKTEELPAEEAKKTVTDNGTVTAADEKFVGPIQP